MANDSQDQKSPSSKLINRISDWENFRQEVQVLLDETRSRMNADGATYVIREGDHCRYFDEKAIAPLWRGQAFPLGACISGWVMTFNSQICIPDITLDNRIPQDAYRPTFVKSLCMVPIGHSDAVGAIGTYWSNKHVTTDEDFDKLHELSNYAYIAQLKYRYVTTQNQQSPTQSGDLAKNDSSIIDMHRLLHGLKVIVITGESVIRRKLEALLSTFGANLQDLENTDQIFPDSIVWVHDFISSRAEEQIRQLRQTFGSKILFVHVLNGVSQFRDVSGRSVTIDLSSPTFAASLGYSIAGASLR